MSRRYDSRTTTFSPEGRLYQVEYAMEAISHAGTVVGILAKDGVVLAAEKKVTSKLLEQDQSSEKIFTVAGNVVVGVAGITADANSLVNYSRNAAQQYLVAYDDDMPVEQLAQRLCDLKQGYTQYGGLRPFGVSILYAGYDDHHHFQLYHSDPSGNYSGWKATCIGSNNGTATSLLKQDYKDDISIQDAMAMAVKILSKTMDSTSLDSEKLEFATLTLNASTGKPQTNIFKPNDIDRLLERHGLAKPKDPEAAAAATATGSSSDAMAVDS
ncbi:N-terminal nucleophile aminohydrolase [Testicularia cyperi]|uniref:Proteasome subunit alpha type n=1 Tax=Testicularia cyperi TaxID=1882483 RepID=A0A317XSK1_9BASI|nr:N-terminal nucleophile aminohydrolase [Testicularia cyperi]